ncbi:MAG: cytosine permease [Acidobacteriales bacterium 59-55]|nr:cytosine permease [Terriglobales bacterium]OJV44044.1 MAG: cytosine permease [Acidobacteriales bacterium 59-55]
MDRSVPQYVDRSVPVPLGNRVPWYKSTFPTYAGIFLWVGFYLKLAEPTLTFASVSTCLWGLLVAGILCFALYYYVPAMLGMKTGQPLYVVGTSTFGTTGGYLIPGLMMGFLQVGWVAVIGAVAADFIMKGLGQTSRTLFSVIAVVWIYSLGWVAIKGIHHVARVAKFLNWVPLIMVIIVFWANRGGISHYQTPHSDEMTGFLNVLTVVIGYFATAGAAGADFGMNNANRKDVVLGGVFGIVVGVLIAGGLPILAVAGYLGNGGQGYDYSAAIASIGALAPIMFFLFAAASLVPSCFSSFIASNSFSTMLPKVPRTVSTLAALTLSVILAVTGVASNLVGFFSIVGASFGPICGAMMADYLLAGKRWSGPRAGINWAGCIAWAVGFLVGIPEHLPGIPASWVHADNPSGLYSLIVGFIVYIVLAKAGLRSPVVKGQEALSTAE